MVQQKARTRNEKRKEKPHIIFDRTIPEFGGDNLEYLPVEPAAFGHGRVRVPIGRDLAQARTRGRRCRRRCGHGIRRHGGEEHATKDVPELVRGWY